LRPGSIPRVDAHEDGILRRSNVTRFLETCSADGLPAEDLFLPNDLVEGTPHGLARVARTINALVTWEVAEVSTPTSFHSFPDESSVNPEELSSFSLCLLSKPERPLVTASAGDLSRVPPSAASARMATCELPPPRPPRSPRRPPTHKSPQRVAGVGDARHTPSVDGAITRSTMDQPSIKNQSTSLSIKDQSAKEWVLTNEPTVPLTKRVAPPSKKIYPLVIHQSTANESLTNQSRVSPRRRYSRGTNNQSRLSAGSMLSHWTNSQSRVSAGSMLSRWISDQFRNSAGSMLSHRNNNQSREPSQGAIFSYLEDTQFIAPPLKRATRRTKQVSPSTENTSILRSLDGQLIASPRTDEASALQENGAAHYPIGHSDLADGFVPESALTVHPSRMMMWWHRIRRVFSRLSWRKRRQRIPSPPPANPNLDHFATHGHTFVYATFSKCTSYSCS
jgi:hypothetical protein